MDSKFGSDNQWFISPLICLQKFKENAVKSSKMLEEMILNKKEDELASVLIEKTGCSLETAENIVSKEIALENILQRPVDPTSSLEDFRGEKEDLNDHLQTHRYIKKRNEYNDSSRQRKSAFITSLKYDKYRINAGERSDLFRPQIGEDEPCDEDIVIVVDVMVPYNRILSSSEMRSSRLLKPQHKFLLRGETPLMDLRKKILCVADAVVPLEDGNELAHPDYENSTAELFPSSFIFINDTFYADISHKNSNDISEPIRDFMEKHQCFDKVEVVDMSGIKVIDLKLRLGQPYVFQHSGNCEHLLVFHDLRLLHPTDLQMVDKYPLLIFEKNQEKKCEACHKGTATYVVEQSELLPVTYMYFCESCFTDFHFPNGVKAHAFKAWPYFELSKLNV